MGRSQVEYRRTGKGSGRGRGRGRGKQGREANRNVLKGENSWRYEAGEKIKSDSDENEFMTEHLSLLFEGESCKSEVIMDDDYNEKGKYYRNSGSQYFLETNGDFFMNGKK